jgi:rod shape-determining protein MreD
MNYFLYLAGGLLLVICQTTLLPLLPVTRHFFDLLLPLVIYLAVFRPLHEALPFTLFLGILVDNLSGGPFGLYVTSYVWLLIGARLAAMVVRAENPIMLVLLLIAAVAAQNGLFLAVLGSAGSGNLWGGFALRVMTEQIGWVLLIGPFLAWGMRHVHRRSLRRVKTAKPASPAAS